MRPRYLRNLASWVKWEYKKIQQLLWRKKTINELVSSQINFANSNIKHTCLFLICLLGIINKVKKDSIISHSFVLIFYVILKIT